MRVALISHSASFYTTNRLLSAAHKLGHAAELLDPVRVYLGPSGPATPEGGPIAPPHVVIPRIGDRLHRWGLSLLEAVVGAGAATAVDVETIARVHDKARTQVALQRARIPVIPTAVIRERAHIDAALTSLAAFAPDGRWIIKPVHGAQGGGVIQVDSATGANSTLDALMTRRKTSIIQPYVVAPDAPSAPSQQRDLRVLVAGGEALAAAWRIAKPGEFRTNVHQGGTVRPYAGDRAPLDWACRAAAAVGLAFAGVDLIEYDGGWAVLEVNANPGIAGVEAASRRDLATPFVTRYLKAARPL